MRNTLLLLYNLWSRRCLLVKILPPAMDDLQNEQKRKNSEQRAAFNIPHPFDAASKSPSDGPNAAAQTEARKLATVSNAVIFLTITGMVLGVTMGVRNRGGIAAFLAAGLAIARESVTKKLSIPVNFVPIKQGVPVAEVFHIRVEHVRKGCISLLCPAVERRSAKVAA